jgi:hypothetical protein
MKDMDKMPICRAERENEKRYTEVKRAFADGDMPLLLRRYLLACSSPSVAAYPGDDEEDGPAFERRGKRTDSRPRLPNPAGFCRFLDLDSGAFQRLLEEFPTEVGRILAVFEDEALNSELSASVLGLYLKALLGDDERETNAGGISVTFDHDILSDGR